VPELQRFGNSKRQELNRSELVAACEGEFVEVIVQGGKECMLTLEWHLGDYIEVSKLSSERACKRLN